MSEMVLNDGLTICYRDTSAARILNYVIHLRDHLEMIRHFLSYLDREFPGLPDSIPFDQIDEWPLDFEDDQDYLREAIINLEKNVEQVHETVCKKTQRKKVMANFLS